MSSYASSSVSTADAHIGDAANPHLTFDRRRPVLADRHGLARRSLFNLDALNDHILHRPTFRTGRFPGDGLNHILAFQHPSEDGVGAVQVGSCGGGDEKLICS